MSPHKKPRIIAVEEHFATPAFQELFGQFEVFPGEEPEHGYMFNLCNIPPLRDRLLNFETRIAEMDQSGTDVAVLSLNPPGVQLVRDAGLACELASQMNDTLSGLVRERPDRFAGLGTLAPQDPKAAAREIKRIMGPLGLGGVMINSHTGGHYLDEPGYEPILAALEEENATLYLHPRVPSPGMLEPYNHYGMLAAIWGFQAEAGLHAVRLIMSGVFDRHPRLKIVLGHAGEGLPYWMWRLDNISGRTFHWAGKELGMPALELTPSEYLRRNFAVTTSGVADPDVLAFCIHKLGAENVMFAIDYPYEDSATATAFLENSLLDAETRDRVSHRNAERLFRVAPVNAS